MKGRAGTSVVGADRRICPSIGELVKQKLNVSIDCLLLDKLQRLCLNTSQSERVSMHVLWQHVAEQTSDLVGITCARTSRANPKSKIGANVVRFQVARIAFYREGAAGHSPSQQRPSQADPSLRNSSNAGIFEPAALLRSRPSTSTALADSSWTLVSWALFQLVDASSAVRRRRRLDCGKS